jgi:hypothetical protein
MALEVVQSGVSGEFPLAPTTTTTETQIAQGFEVTVAYAITPEENYAGPPGGVKPIDPVA